MGGNPRPATWAPSRWRALAPTVALLRREGWPVYASCMACGHASSVDLERLAEGKGADFILWGRTARCREHRCRGRVMFLVNPPRADGPVPML